MCYLKILSLSTRSVTHFCNSQCQNYRCCYCCGKQIFLLPVEPSWGQCWSQNISRKCHNFSPRQSCTIPCWHLECFGVLWGPRHASRELLCSSKYVTKSWTLSKYLNTIHTLFSISLPEQKAINLRVMLTLVTFVGIGFLEVTARSKLCESPSWSFPLRRGSVQWCWLLASYLHVTLIKEL